MRQAGAAVGSHYDQVRALGLRRADDLHEGRPHAQQAARLEPAFAQPVYATVQFALRGQALLLGDSADGLQGERIGSDARFQAEADRGQGLGHMQKDDFGAELARDILGILLCVSGVFGKIGRRENFADRWHFIGKIRREASIGKSGGGITGAIA